MNPVPLKDLGLSCRYCKARSTEHTIELRVLYTESFVLEDAEVDVVTLAAGDPGISGLTPVSREQDQVLHCTGCGHESSDPRTWRDAP